MRDDRRDVTGTENVRLINKIETVSIQQTLFHILYSNDRASLISK